jgi:hypothetical protein
MSMTPENALSWRELSDQLTAEPIAELERSEQGYRYRATQPKPCWSTEPRSDTDIGRLLLQRAQKAASDNLHDVLFADVALPAGAVFGDAWEGDDLKRIVMGPDRGITDSGVIVWTSAVQSAQGRITSEQPEPPQVHIEGGALGLNSDQARELASVLLEAADEMDSWSSQ